MSKFVLSDERLNRYGFRVLTEGIELEDFRNNPVMLYMHRRFSEDAIGKWDNIRIENGKLVADATFDQEDERAKTIESKVNQGILKAASIGIDILATSEEPEHLLPGQRRPTVTKCRIYEASIVDIPANPGALQMGLEIRQNGITLGADVSDDSLSLLLPELKKEPQMDFKNIAKKLGLPETAGEQEILAAIEAQQTLAAKSVPALLAMGRAKGVINDSNQKHYESLAAANFDSTLALIESAATPAPAATPEASKETPAAPAAQVLSFNDMIKLMKDSKSDEGDERTKWTLTDWRKNDPAGLAKLKAEKPEEFEKLVAALK